MIIYLESHLIQNGRHLKSNSEISNFNVINVYLNKNYKIAGLILD